MVHKKGGVRLLSEFPLNPPWSAIAPGSSVLNCLPLKWPILYYCFTVVRCTWQFHYLQFVMGSLLCSVSTLYLCYQLTFWADWSCRSVYRRQDLCVAKIVLWILTSCTYWWENRYPYTPLLHDGTPLHSWLMTPLPIVGWCPPYP